jgi:hypothetical protein
MVAWHFAHSSATGARGRRPSPHWVLISPMIWSSRTTTCSATTDAQQIFIDKVLQAQTAFHRGRVTVHHVSDVADAWRA